MTAFSRQMKVFIDKNLDQDSRSRRFANYAREVEGDIQENNRRILGRKSKVTRSVDGVSDAPLESVSPGGTIFLNFDVNSEMLPFIDDLLKKLSPFDPTPDGIHFKDHHVIYVDDVKWSPEQNVGLFDRIFIFNDLFYGGKIERRTAFYQSVVIPVLKRNFGQAYRFRFTYTSNYTSGRVPAIFIRPQ